MKIFSQIIVFLFLGMGFCQATPELDALEAKIRAELPGSEWQIVKDWRSITLTRTNVQFLNPVGLPPLSEGELWNRYSFRSDYRITVMFDTKLTQSEYDDLSTLKRTFTAKRTAGLDPSTKDFFGRSSEAQGVIRLPNYCLDRFSEYLCTSDNNFFRIRPDSVRITREKVLAILEKSCVKYCTKAEQDGAANGSQPIRAETNRASESAGSRR